jgi:hypothetical protein
MVIGGMEDVAHQRERAVSSVRVRSHLATSLSARSMRTLGSSESGSFSLGRSGPVWTRKPSSTVDILRIVKAFRKLAEWGGVPSQVRCVVGLDLNDVPPGGDGTENWGRARIQLRDGF